MQASDGWLEIGVRRMIRILKISHPSRCQLTHSLSLEPMSHLASLLSFTFFGSALGLDTEKPPLEPPSRRQLGLHDPLTFSVHGHKCYRAGCEKFDEHLHHWVKDPHCCAYTNGYLGREWARCAAGVRRTVRRKLDFEYIFKGQFHVGHECVGAGLYERRSCQVSHLVRIRSLVMRGQRRCVNCLVCQLSAPSIVCSVNCRLCLFVLCMSSHHGRNSPNSSPKQATRRLSVLVAEAMMEAAEGLSWTPPATSAA